MSNMNFIIADMIEFLLDAKITFTHRDSAKIKSKQFAEFDYNGHVIFFCSKKFVCHSGFLQPYLCSKVQHLQCDLRLEVQHLVMLCIHGIVLFCYFTFEFIAVKPEIKPVATNQTQHS